jgi:trans-2-enoyl-CoA reductase
MAATASASTKPAACASTTDIVGYREEFLKLFGFGLPGIDYDADINPHVELGG